MALKSFFFLTFMFVMSLSASALITDSEYNSNPTNLQKPNLENEKLLSTLIGIQGIIYCRSGGKLTPLQGALARITCEGVDDYGHETESYSLSILSDATDEKGYFLATLSPYEIKQYHRMLRDCKAFLEDSPSQTCDVPIDENNGISGAPLASNNYHLLHDNNMKLFTVGPFFFTPGQQAKSISNEY